MAQESQRGLLEEVIVTAQKRAESIQDVPISIASVSGDMMESRQLTTFERLVPDLPNVEFVSSPGLDKALGIRGLFTSTGNPAFEQSVGVFSDSVYISRGRLYNLSFNDVDRVEVLRGPQGVLNGKNAIAGAINIYSKLPSDELEAGFLGSYEFENEGYSGTAYVTGPITDELSGRAYIKSEKIGGYLDFPRTGRDDQNESEFLSFKGSLLYEPTSSFGVVVRYSRQDAKQLGVEFGPFLFQESVADTLEAEYRENDPNFDLVTNDIISNGRLLRVDEAGEIFISNERPEAGTDIDIAAMQLDWELSNGGQITGITGYLNYSSYLLQTQAFRPVDFLVTGDKDDDENFDQWSQELRYVSPGGETLDYLFGVYLHSADLNINKNDSVLSAEALGAPAEFNFLPIEKFSQEARSISVFGQGTWNFTENLRASVGLRYTEEEKKADGAVRFYSTDRSMIVGGQPPGSPGFNPIADLFGSNWSDSASRSESTWDPSVIGEWNVAEDKMLYVSWTQANKAGGFNAADLDGVSFEYEGEEAKSWEIGSKLSFLDDQLRWNLAIFRTEYTDLQVSAWNAASNTFITNNAAEATVEGFESDLIYAINANWTLGGALGYLDAKYDNYPGANCSVGESREANCDADNTRNAAGDRLRQAPEWTTNTYVDYVQDISEGLAAGFRLTVNYSDSYFMSDTNDPYLSVDSYTKSDLLIWLGSADEVWRISALGRNLTDERVPYFANSTPLVDEAYFSSVQAGREYYLEFAYRF
ncbi:MAG: TonB-dependent receptor [Pseudomonadota bacterium]